MKTNIVLLTAFILGLLAQMAIGAGVNKQTYSDRHGTITQRSYQSGNTTRFYSGTGQYQGFSYQSGNRVNYYNKSAEHLGSSTQTGNTFRFFYSNGRQAGSSK